VFIPEPQRDSLFVWQAVKRCIDSLDKIVLLAARIRQFPILCFERDERSRSFNNPLVLPAIDYLIPYGSKKICSDHRSGMQRTTTKPKTSEYVLDDIFSYIIAGDVRTSKAPKFRPMPLEDEIESRIVPAIQS
jgi:hypothetical protein